MALIILLTGIGIWFMLGRVAFLCLEEAVKCGKMKLITKDDFGYNDFEYSTFIHAFGPISFAIIIIIYLIGYIREFSRNISLFIASFCYALRNEVKQRIYKYQEERKNRWDK